MKKYEMLITLGGGGLLLGMGIVMLIMGSGWGVLALIAGFSAVAFGYTKLMRGSGNNPDQGTYHGLGGQGKQQSEVVKMDQPVIGEQNATIWEKIEK